MQTAESINFATKKNQNKTKQNDILNCVVDDPISTTYNKLGRKKNPRRI